MPSPVRGSGLAWINSELRRMEKAGFVMDGHWYAFITKAVSTGMHAAL